MSRLFISSNEWVSMSLSASVSYLFVETDDKETVSYTVIVKNKARYIKWLAQCLANGGCSINMCVCVIHVIYYKYVIYIITTIGMIIVILLFLITRVRFQWMCLNSLGQYRVRTWLHKSEVRRCKISFQFCSLFMILGSHPFWASVPLPAKCVWMWGESWASLKL